MGEGWRIIRKALSEEKRVSTKTSAADLVTETDHVVEALILQELQTRFPSHRFIAEEAAAAGAKCVLTPSPTWIVDPIDGTCNFVHRFPTVAVSIGFAVNQELEFGVIYHCTEERLYTGRRGQGAFCNGQRLRVSGETDLSKALVLTEIGPRRDPATLKLFLSNMERLLHAGAHGVRVIGSSTLALCHLAAGTADAYYQFGLHCWDLAAATVIIREAGGVVMDTSGELGRQAALHPQGCVPRRDAQAQTDILPPLLTDRSGRQWTRPEGFSRCLVWKWTQGQDSGGVGGGRAVFSKLSRPPRPQSWPCAPQSNDEILGGDPRGDLSLCLEVTTLVIGPTGASPAPETPMQPPLTSGFLWSLFSPTFAPEPVVDMPGSQITSGACAGLSLLLLLLGAWWNCRGVGHDVKTRWLWVSRKGRPITAEDMSVLYVST
uniref:Inositol monophosphatase 1 n=1 Tax=Bos mutus grunniens TaxID=30521 RepID=A0A8B9YTI6_BOSMU